MYNTAQAPRRVGIGAWIPAEAKSESLENRGVVFSIALESYESRSLPSIKWTMRECGIGCNRARRLLRKYGPTIARITGIVIPPEPKPRKGLRLVTDTPLIPPDTPMKRKGGKALHGPIQSEVIPPDTPQGRSDTTQPPDNPTLFDSCPLRKEKGKIRTPYNPPFEKQRTEQLLPPISLEEEKRVKEAHRLGEGLGLFAGLDRRGLNQAIRRGLQLREGITSPELWRVIEGAYRAFQKSLGVKVGPLSWGVVAGISRERQKNEGE